MTIKTSGELGFNNVNAEIGQAETYSSDLGWLNGIIVAPQRPPAQPELGVFYGMAYYQKNNAGNCNNANAGNCNCNCGNVQCSASANCQNINCVNCDAQPWLQANCNCACTYNCNSNQNCYSYNCNCSKIICTKLFQLGRMDKGVFEADQQFGAELVKNHPDIYNGYVAWAQTVVDWMSGEGPQMMLWIRDKEQRKAAQIKWSTEWAEQIATPWAEWMAYKMGQREESNPVGLALMVLGTPISKAIGVWQRIFGKSKKPAGFVTGLFLIIIFVLLKSIVVIGNPIANLFKGRRYAR